MAKLYLSHAWLYKRYIIDKRTVEQIAKEANCTRQTIYFNLKKFGLVK